jgi:hypothetical protein
LTIDAHKGGWGRGVRSKKWSHKKAIKHEKGDPSIFLATLSTPLKEFDQNPMDPSPRISNYCASMVLASTSVYPVDTF